MPRHPQLTRVWPALAVLGLSAAVAGTGFLLLWRESLGYGLILTAVLFSGGATLLPTRNVYAHAFSVGSCLGAFVGAGLGAAAAFSAHA